VSLRLRLMFAFLAIALVMAGLSALALRNSWRVQQEVNALTGVSIARFEREHTLGRALAVEGEWRQDGVFVASEIEMLASPRRPKLRGEVQALDVQAGRLTLYGVPIAVDDGTDFLGGEVRSLAELQAGARVEVSCEILDSGGWRARKVRSGGLKESDKIKGVVTRLAMDGIAPDSLEISGIPVVIDVVDRLPDPRIELLSTAHAVRMNLAAQGCITAAGRVLGGAGRMMATQDGELVDARTLLEENADDLAETLDRARSALAAEKERALGSALWLDPLADELAALEPAVEEFLALVDQDAAAAAALYESTLEPLLADRILPLIHGYLLESQESLALEVERISAQAAATARALLGVSAVALIFALGLGYIVWRTIAAPLSRLQEAAAQIGHGRLDTRVPVRSGDELGVLAETINRMAGELEATTVSIANLDAVFASMAGGLFVLDSDGIVKNVNRAGAALLGVAAEEVVGRDFREICRTEQGEAPALPSASGAVASAACRLHRDDGGTVPVSYSGALLRGEGGPGRGSVCVVQDVSDRMAMEERLRRSLAEKELLLREVHHRVKNNLQVISSLLDLQSSGIQDPETRRVYADSQARIRSMALIHQQLYGASDLDRIDLGAYVTQLSGSLFQFHGGVGDIAFEADVDPVRLGLDKALSCGLIINELVTNALKHAFAPGEPGRVTVGLKAVNGLCRLTVADTGRGLPDGPAGRPGSLGMSLVEALCEQLDGELTVESGAGARFTLTFPLDEERDVVEAAT